MEYPDHITKVLLEYGVGKRSHDDELLKANKILSEMTERLGVFDIDYHNNSHTVVDFKCNIPGCTSEFENLIEYESHYNTAHRYMCCQCKKNLPSAHFLDLHVAEAHDSFFAALAERTPSYACYIETCTMKFVDSKERMDHCIKDHRFPANFRFDQGNASHKRGSKGKSKHSKANKNNDDLNKSPMDIGDDQNVKSYIKPATKEFHFCNTRPRNFVSNKKYSGKKFTDEKSNRSGESSNLESENMLLDLKNNLPEC